MMVKMSAVRLSVLLMLLLAALGPVLAKPAEIRIVKREAIGSSGVSVIAFPDSLATGGREEPILSEAKEENTGLEREQRSPEADFGDYGDDDDDGPEGRHLKLKHKHKFRPHKHQGLLGSYAGLLGGLGGYGHGHGHGGHGFGGHGHGHGHGQGHKPFLGGHGCKKLHGCGGGWQQPSYGGYGPIASAFAGPSQGYGPWRPGPYGGQRPGAQSHFATYNLGPFQASFGLAQAG